MIVHLAAQTYVPAARKDPWPTFEINIRGTINVLESMKALNLRQSRVLIVGSSEAYGFVRADDLPLDENQPFNPGANPYSVSKIAQDMLGLQYFQSDGLTVLRARPFNHIGPGQQPIFVAPNFATQIAEIEAGLKPPVLRVGNLAAERDFSDVRDVVRAYHLILTRGEPGAVYNICSGRALSIQRLVDILIGYARRDITVEVDPERVRPVDVPRVVGDFSALQQATGWQPAYTIEDTLRDVLDDCRQQVAARHQSG
jgi:GDP-4-dehydro-6-deoxy-D-mannose reductase